MRSAGDRVAQQALTVQDGWSKVERRWMIDTIQRLQETTMMTKATEAIYMIIHRPSSDMSHRPRLVLLIMLLLMIMLLPALLPPPLLVRWSPLHHTQPAQARHSGPVGRRTRWLPSGTADKR